MWKLVLCINSIRCTTRNFYHFCRLNHTYYEIFIRMCKLVQIVIAVGVTLRLRYFNESTYYFLLLISNRV